MTPVRGVEAKDIAGCWREVKPFIQRGLRYAGGLHSLDDVKKDLIAGRKQLLRTDDPPCVLVSELLTDVNGHKFCNVFLVAGKLPLDWSDILEGIKGWARSKNCKSIRMDTERLGWSRLLPGWRVVRVTFQKDLWE